MNSKIYSSRGIILGRRNFGEADRILSVFSEDHGRLSLLAKGVRKPKSRKRGHIEIFSLIKFQAVKGKGLDLITEAEVEDGFDSLRKNLKRISVAYYVTEVVQKITQENEPNTRLFDLITDTLSKLGKVKELKLLREDFVKKILVQGGYWPEGKEMRDSDAMLEEVIERQVYSTRVGKLIAS
jgi:DNA repair protein RecO (recombination protein O)